MKLCDKCFSVVEPKATYCAECGAPVEDNPQFEGSDAVVYPEIARANLFRMRGDAAEAEKVCLGILKRFPNNPAAHVLLGDIQFESGDLDRAKQWYEMALDLTPENARVVAKLKLVNEQLAKRKQEKAVSGLEVDSSQNRMTLYIGSLVLLIVVGILAFWLGGVRASALRDKRSDVIEPISINGLPPKAPIQPKSEPAPPPNSQPPAPASPMTPTESALLASVAPELGPLGARLALLTINLKSGSALATVISEPQAANPKNAVDAAQVAVAILRKSQTPAISRVDVRILDSTSRQVVFSAGATPESVSAATGQPGTVDWASSVLLDAAPR